MRVAALLITFLAFAVSSAAASQVVPIKLAELEAKADYVVLAKVTKVVEDGNTDHVTIEVASYLKGKSDVKSYTFELVTRGGLKDFDPALKVKQSCVVFLKAQGKPGEVTRAYWGSVATFPKDFFE